ncbi:hypothetical protein B7463_g12779, partial [Scytalidium lignicola]
MKYSAGDKLSAHKFWATDTVDQKVLQIKGLEVDHIQEVIDDYSWDWPNKVGFTGGVADRMLQWLKCCLLLTCRTIGYAKDYVEVYWQTLFAFARSSEPPPDFPFDPVHGLQSHRRLLEKIRDFEPHNDKSDLDQEELKEAADSTVPYLGNIWRGRVFFSTKKGRIGMADKNIKVDDSVCLFCGLSPMYILQALDHNYSFKSEAYIHGLMDDAASALGILQKDFEPKIFKIL